MKNALIALLLTVSFTATAQRNYWQQYAEYTMNIDMDVNTNQFTGTQTLRYTNNSPDTLNRAFYHLYFNAFQPGSMMDERSRTIKDPSKKIADKISKLSPEEIGYQRITKLTVDGATATYEVVGTILEVSLPAPILPGATAVFDMEFNAQVPIQIRRSGRDGSEGIRYSMTQWYPKMAEFDDMGWHANPYIGREFYGIYGKFDVTINIDKSYLVGGTGNLQNPNEVGHGYEMTGSALMRPAGDKLKWHFTGDNIHDFAWAADPDYQHIKKVREDGTVLHYLFQPKDADNEEDWRKLPGIMDTALTYMEAKYGQYPYKQYTVIQGGDGGMEYPMATLITGHRNLGSLVGVTVHEMFHSWYQGVLGTNESLYPWMDEGFTSFGSSHTMNFIKEKGLIPGTPVADPIAETVAGLVNYNKAGISEPINTHADHYTRNSAYSVASYVKGSAFLQQINYIVGQEAFDRGMLRYYNTWKFKHPTPNDFLRVMEKESGLELDWFKEYFVNTTKLPDYEVVKVASKEKKTSVIQLKNNGGFPMPIDVLVNYKTGKSELFHIPMTIMRGNKLNENTGEKWTVLPDWGWVYSDYEFIIPIKVKKISSVQIDPSGRMLDSNVNNNKFSLKKDKKKKKKKGE